MGPIGTISWEIYIFLEKENKKVHFHLRFPPRPVASKREEKGGTYLNAKGSPGITSLRLYESSSRANLTSTLTTRTLTQGESLTS